MIREVVTYGHPVLRQKGKPIQEITPEIRTLASDMLETMYEYEGVGLAAQQINEPLLITVIDVAEASRKSKMWFSGIEVPVAEYMPMVLINPRIKLSGEIKIDIEGCLSFPGIGGNVMRHQFSEVEATLLNGKAISFKCSGLLACAIQHEIDHLNGILFIDKMIQKDKLKIKTQIRDLRRETIKSLD